MGDGRSGGTHEQIFQTWDSAWGGCVAMWAGGDLDCNEFFLLKTLARVSLICTWCMSSGQFSESQMWSHDSNVGSDVRKPSSSVKSFSTSIKTHLDSLMSVTFLSFNCIDT